MSHRKRRLNSHCGVPAALLPHTEMSTQPIILGCMSTSARIIFQLWVFWLAILLSSLGVLLSSLRVIWSSVTAVAWPTRISRTQDHAVIILNAEDGTFWGDISAHEYSLVSGIGRNTAIRYSELGYTVFALCSDQSHRSSSNVSSASSPLHTLAIATYQNIDSIFLASQERAIARSSLGPDCTDRGGSIITR